MFERFKQDVARWIVMGSVSPVSSVTPKLMLLLLYRYLPLRAVAWFRFGAWCEQKRVRVLPLLIQRYLLRAYGLDIVVGQDIGGGLYIPHPTGTVICAEQIGRNCSIIAAVTIGMRNEWKFPIIGDNVFIGAGARVLGAVTIGDNAKIGANAVVLDDVPPDATAIGIPARITRHINVARVEAIAQIEEIEIL